MNPLILINRLLACLGIPGLPVRARTTDVAMKYRMPAGSPGEVNRTHPASIEPCLICAATPPTEYGQVVTIDTASQGVRPLAAADSTLPKWLGLIVRPYPTQSVPLDSFGSYALGAGVPPTNGSCDVMRTGYILTKLRGATAAVKGNRVYVWISASSGAHVEGGIEAAASGGDTVLLPENYLFNGPADSAGTVEVCVI